MAKSSIVFILLIVLSAISLSLIIYLFIKRLIRLYKEHQETEALVRKFWDTAEAAERVKYPSPENISISLPPFVAHDKQLVEPYRTLSVPGPGVRPFMPAVQRSDMGIQLEPNHHHHHQPPLFLRSASDITRSQQESVPAVRGLADKPHMVVVVRKPLSPLSVDELERRRRAEWCRRLKGPRTAGKENVVPIDGCCVSHLV